MFQQTAGAVAAFRARYGRAPTRGDMWELVRDAIAVTVDGAVVDNGVLERLSFSKMLFWQSRTQPK